VTDAVAHADSFTPPSDAVLTTAVASGIHGWPGYIGGPECAAPTGPGGWDVSAFARIRDKGLRAPGIYVGLGSGQEAVSLARARGIPAGEVIWHDVETQWSMSNESATEAQGWVAAVRSAGYKAGLYGTAAFVNTWGHFYDVVWAAGGAYYRDGPGGNPWPTTPMAVPGCTPNRTPCGVQWWATHDEFGFTIDRSIMGPEFAAHALGDDDLTPAQLLNLKRLPIWMERLHHENWPSDPNAQQSDIDVFANQIGDDLNFEPVITALHGTFESNHQPSTEELIAAIRAAQAGSK
jgi:Rv2525c-like, glycoside hydrolase-like domain